MKRFESVQARIFSNLFEIFIDACLINNEFNDVPSNLKIKNKFFVSELYILKNNSVAHRRKA